MIIFRREKGGKSKEQKRRGGDKEESKEEERRVGDEGLKALIGEIDPSKIEEVDKRLSGQIKETPKANRLSQVFSKLPFFLGMLGTLATVSSALAENPSNLPISDTLLEFIKKSIEIPQLSNVPMFIAELTALTGLGIIIYSVVSRALNRVVRGERRLYNKAYKLIVIGLLLSVGFGALNLGIREIGKIFVPHRVAADVKEAYEVLESERKIVTGGDPILLKLERWRKIFSEQAKLITEQEKFKYDLIILSQEIKLLQLQGQLKEVDILIELVSKAKQLQALLETSSVPFKEGITIPSEVAKEQLEVAKEQLKIEDIKNLINDIKNLIPKAKAKLEQKHPTLNKILEEIEKDLAELSSRL
jgi:hypothetical protein